MKKMKVKKTKWLILQIGLWTIIITMISNV